MTSVSIGMSDLSIIVFVNACLANNQSWVISRQILSKVGKLIPRLLFLSCHSDYLCRPDIPQGGFPLLFLFEELAD